MHNSTNGISNEVIKKLNNLANCKQINKFRESLNSLSRDHKQCYRRIITAKGHASAMFGILNAVEKYEAINIFNDLLQKNKDFAFKTLDDINPRLTLFRTLFGALNQYESEYIQHVKAKSRGSKAMFGILNAVEKYEAINIFNDLLQENKDFAFKTLDSIAGHQFIILFRTLFGALNQYESEYIQHVIEKQKSSSAMSGILNAVEKYEAINIFNDLLQKNKDFAFKTLDNIAAYQHTLFKTLFGQLNSQRKEDYKIHLETKPKVKAQFTLRKFYSNNKNGASKLKTKNSNKDSLDNELLAQKRKRADSDEFSALNPASFFPSSVTLEEMVDKYEFDTRDPISDFSYDKKNQLCSQTIYWITGKQPSSNLQYLALKGYNELTEHELEEICTGHQRIL